MTGKYARQVRAHRLTHGESASIICVPTGLCCRSRFPSDSRDHRPRMTAGQPLQSRGMPAGRSHVVVAEQPCYGPAAIAVRRTLAMHLLNSLFSTKSIPRPAPPLQLMCSDHWNFVLHALVPTRITIHSWISIMAKPTSVIDTVKMHSFYN